MTNTKEIDCNHSEYDFVETIEKYYPVKFQDIIASNLPLNSTFDEDLEDKHFRIHKTKYLDEYTGELESSEYTLECFCAHLNSDAEWENIVQYPRYASGSKTQNERYRLERIIKNLKIN